jgi:hypothetical protein
MTTVYQPIFTGSDTVAAAATPEPVKSSYYPCAWFHLQALESNSSPIYVQTVGSATTTGIRLNAGEVIQLPPGGVMGNYIDLARIYVEVAVNGEGYRYLGGTQ